MRPGHRVPKIGPGPGRLLIPAAKQVLPGGETVGIDIQPKMIERLKRRAHAEGVTNLETIVGDATNPLVPEASFDIVFLCTALGGTEQEIRSNREREDGATLGKCDWSSGISACANRARHAANRAESTRTGRVAWPNRVRESPDVRSGSAELDVTDGPPPIPRR